MSVRTGKTLRMWLQSECFKKRLQTTSVQSLGPLCFPLEMCYAVMKACGLTVLGLHTLIKDAWLQSKGQLSSGLPLHVEYFWQPTAPSLLTPSLDTSRKITMSGIICQCLQEICTLNTAFIFGKPVEAVTQPNEGCPTELGSYSQADVMQCDILDTGVWGILQEMCPLCPPNCWDSYDSGSRAPGKRLDANKSNKVFSKKKICLKVSISSFGFFSVVLESFLDLLTNR